MKHILDSSFRYRPSFDTDIRKTFDRVRKAQRPKDEKPPVKLILEIPTLRAVGGKK